MNENDEKYFPTDYDEYYYYCRISIIEEAKEKYLKCNDLLLGSGINNSPAMKLLSNETNEKRQIIYNKYKRLYDNFIKYCNKLINKDKVDNVNVYIHYMENLMRISNETIAFTNQNFCMRKESREKFEYDGKNKKLSYIIDQNRNIPYILNPDDIATRISNKYIKPILFFLILGIALIGCFCGIHGFNIIVTYDSIIDMICGYICIGTFVFFLILSISLLYIRIKYRKSIDFDELKGSLNTKNYFLVVHPYKSRKFSFKDIMEILKFWDYFRH